MFHDQRFYVAVSFVLFFLIFGRKLWAAIAGILDARAEQVRSNLDEASRLRREAEKMLEDATREREQALAESRALIERSREEAAAIAERARHEAEAIAARREQMARDRITASERAAVREVREMAASVAIQATRTLLAQHFADEHASASTLLDRAIGDLPGALKASNETGPRDRSAA
ncbi:F0F1 ATP synthase subunit B family protein [Swaminathania salitolerans]|uniref:ATP synthase subunit b n=1 Tax=Swaminathania salitolerans TaxID=182838 RepID=A0A511BPT2_9PROT|nr:ATP synthase F0 subunit B [Swaminathania salitolerans]GBQ13518.1 ATP synthase F0 subunit beta' [Swaminathania salitolerans LMG 21291]GEL02330.1 ATP synthase subunit b [Swaminathania salitolerans]